MHLQAFLVQQIIQENVLIIIVIIVITGIKLEITGIIQRLKKKKKKNGRENSLEIIILINICKLIVCMSNNGNIRFIISKWRKHY